MSGTHMQSIEKANKRKIKQKYFESIKSINSCQKGKGRRMDRSTQKGLFYDG